MKKSESEQSGEGCCPGGKGNREAIQLQPLSTLMAAAEDDAPCCGPKPEKPSSPYEKPGYLMCHFVADFVETAVGAVPRVETRLSWLDLAGSVRARIGVWRNRFKVAPGLYCVGTPDKDSPVLVSANYKLSFDCLRKELEGIDAWLLVLDTRGINVWCAAGKKTFSTEEVVSRVHNSGLDKLVDHRELIVPQLGAPGVSAHKVKEGCGFSVRWGPIKARDLKAFLENGRKAEPHMRQVTFTLVERVVLIPVELYLIIKPSLVILLAMFVLSGISPDIFSFSAAWNRGLNGASAYVLGVMAGAVAVPVLLPWLPARQFFIKGIVTGIAGAIPLVLYLGESISRLESVTMLLLTVSVSSYAAMNFTGATPYTSPSGVEKEMRQGIPVQALAVLTAVVAWIAAPFIN